VDLGSARKYADESSILLVETSAKTGHNISELFVLLARRLPDVVVNNETLPTGTVSLASAQATGSPKAGAGCCGS